MANLKAKLMFDRDLEDAFFHVIKYRLSLNVQDVKAHNVDFFICPPKKLQEKLHKYGCWCDEARTAPHNYKYCDNIKGIPYPSIIGKDPSAHGNGNIPLCPDLDENVPKRLKDHNHRLGCFKPVKSADIFMDWFMQQGVKNYTSYPECRYETKLVRKFVDDYMRQVSAFETCEINKDDGEDMVLGLLLGFQGRDATDAALKSHVAWEAERLLKFLRWNEERFKTCLEELRSAMDEVIKMRSTNSFQGGRSRREWERPRRSPLGEQYGREESPWGRPRREYSPWRCISPEEPYNKEESTRRRNPPEEHYRDERQWQDPPRERQGRSPSRKRYEREDRKPSPSRARSRGEDGRRRYTFPKEQSGGGYGEQSATPTRGSYEPRLSSPPRGKSGGRVADSPRGRYEPRPLSPQRGYQPRPLSPLRGRYEPRPLSPLIKRYRRR